VWIRPDNLDPQRLSTPRTVLDQQCTHFHGAATDITADKMRSLFSLDGWADDARALIEAMNVTLTMSKRDDSTESFTYVRIIDRRCPASSARPAAAHRAHSRPLAGARVA
jgi:phenylacetic acid degradation operon negative regulatory protein